MTITFIQRWGSFAPHYTSEEAEPQVFVFSRPDSFTDYILCTHCRRSQILTFKSEILYAQENYDTLQLYIHSSLLPKKLVILYLVIFH
jgi:hypothetical protein